MCVFDLSQINFRHTLTIVKIRAQPPAHRAHCPEGGPGFGLPQEGISSPEVRWLREWWSGDKRPCTLLMDHTKQFLFCKK